MTDEEDGKGRIALIAAIVVVLAAGIGLWTWRRSTRLREETETTVAATRVESDRSAYIPVSPDDPSWGSSSAPVTIVLFGDLQCPFMARVLPSIERLKAEYGPAKVRIVWKNRPATFHPEARAAALAAHAVFTLKGSGAFWSFVARAYREPADLEPLVLERWANEGGIDLSTFRGEIASGRPAKKLGEDEALVDRRGIPEEPPAILVNGMLPVYLEAVDFTPSRFEDLRALVDRQLVVAASVDASGGMYAAVSQENLERERKKQRQGGMRAPHRPTLQRIPLTGSPVLGSDDAIVTIVVFSDFACLECKRFAERLKSIVAKRRDKIRVVWKHRPMPFSPRAEPAAELAHEAYALKGNDGFWQAHDKLFASKSLDQAELDRIAGELGLDFGTSRTAVDARKHKAKIDADAAVAALVEEGTWSDTSTYPRYGSVDGGISPLVVINGMPVSIDQGSTPDIEPLVEEAIARFDKEHGDVAAKDWYERLVVNASLGSPSRHHRAPIPDKPARSSVRVQAVHFAGDATRQNPTLLGSVSREQLRKAAAEGTERMRRCHEDALATNPTLEGRVFVEVVVAKNGSVSVAQDGGSSLPDGTVNRCVADVVKSLTFPAVDVEAIAFVLVLELSAL